MLLKDEDSPRKNTEECPNRWGRTGWDPKGQTLKEETFSKKDKVLGAEAETEQKTSYMYNLNEY